jgi:hypothetical protein
MIHNKVIQAVNSNPALLSALYDMNMLPEQITTDEQASTLVLFVAGFVLGQISSKTE